MDVKCDIKEMCDTPIAQLKHHPFWKEVDGIIRASDNWPPQERYYYMAKQICHSSNYGIAAGMFCLNTLEKSKGKIVLRKEQAQDFLSMYHQLFEEIHEWHQQVEKQVRETRMLFNLLGYPIYFTGDLEQHNAVKEMYSAAPQSTVACITRLAYTKLQNFIEEMKLDWDILADTHDSYLVQCPENEAITCAKLMKEFIEIEMTSPVDGAKFKMKSEASIGKNWSGYKENTNPEGLKEVKL